MVPSVNCDIYLHVHAFWLEAKVQTSIKMTRLFLEENELSIDLGKTESIKFCNIMKLRSITND